MAAAAALAETEKQFRMKPRRREQTEVIDISVRPLALVMLCKGH